MTVFLPREGLYIDPIFKLLRTLFLNPAISAFLYLVSTTFPIEILKTDQETKNYLLKALRILIWLGSAYHINAFLNLWSNNNWIADDTWKWDEEIVLITGGSSGIGASAAQSLANKGIRVIILDVAPPTYETGKYIRYYKCDITDVAQIKRVAVEIRAKYGDPTVLVNNAGLTRGFTIVDAPENDIRCTFEVNTMSQFFLTKEFLPAMIAKNHGHVVTVASLAGYTPVTNLVDYSAAKSSAVAFHEGLALELKFSYNAPRVRTTCVSPSFVYTPLFKGRTNLPHFLTPVMHADTVADAIVNQILSGYGASIFLPGTSKYTATIRAFPHWIQNIMRNSSKVMEVDFHGRQELDPNTGKIIA